MSNVSLQTLKRILYTSLFIFAVAIAAVVLTVVQTSRELARQTQVSSQAQFQSVLHLQQDQLIRLVQDYAYWDAAIEHLLVQPDSAWWENNAGDYAVEMFNLSFSLSLDGLSQPIFFSPSDAAPFDLSALLTQPSVLALIDTERRKTMTSDGSAKLGSQGFIEIDGQYHLLSIAAFQPEHADSPINHDPGALLIFGVSLAQQIIPTTAEVMGVRHMQVTADVDAGMYSLPIYLADGTRAADVQWLPDAATSALWSTTKGTLAIVLGLMAAAMGYLILRVRQLTRALGADAAATQRLLAQQKSILETAADGIIGVDAKGRIQLINQAALHLLRANLNQDVLPFESLGDKGGEALRKALTYGLPWRGESHIKAEGFDRDFVADMAIMPIQGDHQSDGAVITLRDISKQKSYERALQEAQQTAENMAKKDSLTGLGNRRSLQEASQAVMHWAERRVPYAVIMLDIDHFKAINDQYGHQHGDIVLTEVARCMSSQARQGDFSIRYGGEELLLILHNTVAPQAEQVAARVHAELHSQQPGGLNVTVSMGVAAGLSSRDDLYVVIHQADLALYQAKQSGRNQTVTFQAEATA